MALDEREIERQALEAHIRGLANDRGFAGALENLLDTMDEILSGLAGGQQTTPAEAAEFRKAAHKLVGVVKARLSLDLIEDGL